MGTIVCPIPIGQDQKIFKFSFYNWVPLFTVISLIIFFITTYNKLRKFKGSHRRRIDDK
jgi:hypothetical protein